MNDYSADHWNEEATRKQLAYLRKLGYDGPEPRTKREAGEAIDSLQPPATEKQLDLLEDLGYDFADGELNKWHASKIIDKLIAERDEAA